MVQILGAAAYTPSMANGSTPGRRGLAAGSGEEAEEYGILAVRLHFLPGSSDGDRVGVYVLRNNRNYSGAMDFSGKLCYNSSSIYKSRKRKQKRRGDSCDSNAYD